MSLSKIQEERGLPFHTSVLSTQNLRGLSRIAVVLLRDYLNRKDWSCELTKTEGSFTLRSGVIVLKLFVDSEEKLRDRLLPTPTSGLSKYVIGVELTHLDPVHRDALRDYLKKRFGSAYADPREGTELKKVWLQPVQSHIYDVAWFGLGPCEEEVSEEELDSFLGSLRDQKSE